MTPACQCHGLPMRWNKDSRYTAGGFWKCAEHGRSYYRDRYANDAGFSSRTRARRIERWHKPDGEYIQSRRKELARQRAEIIARLAELEQEAVTC